MPNKNKLLTITEAADLLKVSKASLRRWSNSGLLACYRIGDRSERRFNLNDLLAFVTTANGKTSLLDIARADSGIQGQPDPVMSPASGPQRKHICTFYKSPREQWQLVRAEFLAHISANARVVYLYHGDRDRVVNWISSEGCCFEELQARQTLRLQSTAETYNLGGYFNTDRMLDFWRNIAAEARQDGIEKLLLTGEMGWANGNLPGHEQLVPYEAALDQMLELYPWVTVVCQYPVYLMSGITVYDNLCVHTHVQLPDRLASGLRHSAF
ncbi:MAG: MEDS domain-containing protein [Gammaproteobacteria bacterium]